MNLMDLSPDDVKISIKGNEYPMEYSLLSLRELETMYEAEETYNQVIRNMFDDIASIKREDVVNFLYAGLIHSDLLNEFIDKRKLPWNINREAAKEYLYLNIVPKQLPLYVMAIIATWIRCNISTEMAEMLEVMAAQSEKKTEITK